MEGDPPYGILVLGWLSLMLSDKYFMGAWGCSGCYSGTEEKHLTRNWGVVVMGTGESSLILSFSSLPPEPGFGSPACHSLCVSHTLAYALSSP